MKILLTNDLGDAMMKQPKEELISFVKSIDKIQELAKPQILLLPTVVDLTSPDDKMKLYAYNISGRNYAVFTFTPNNEMLLVDYIRLSSGGVISLTNPNASTLKNS